ncbi:OadG family protein [Desulfobacula toluolica]|uniref:Conserved uncharacterized protein n=1 Tax=Desulfobacula toluolica (strain DSM 7467 / Tol2) TaxID=651182 RepID=K0N4X0_DESTT|nr:OadG family protein [Desulfobacula toluolica]CCK79164.1 conserved uncharacterized protein, precursor [Desulfobacula toluolica Tol2]
MYGIEAINANNGWAISIVGVSIVFSGLVTLSLVISRLYKVLALWENPSLIKEFFSAKKPEDDFEEVSIDIPAEMKVEDIKDLAGFKEVAKQFALLVRTMEDHFSLSRLLHLAKTSDLKDPHENLNNLLATRIIISDGAGLFTWDKERFDKAVS